MPFHKRLTDSFNKLPDGVTRDFFISVINNEAQKAAAILSRHPDAPHFRDGGGNTPLMVAVLFGEAHGKIIDLLLENGADVNAQNSHGGNALARAAQFGHLSLVKKLLEYGADAHMKDASGRDAADWANGNGRADIAILLLSSQKAPPRQTPPQNKP